MKHIIIIFAVLLSAFSIQAQTEASPHSFTASLISDNYYSTEGDSEKINNKIALGVDYNFDADLFSIETALRFRNDFGYRFSGLALVNVFNKVIKGSRLNLQIGTGTLFDSNEILSGLPAVVRINCFHNRIRVRASVEHNFMYDKFGEDRFLFSIGAGYFFSL